jgi:hypothetical protein
VVVAVIAMLVMEATVDDVVDVVPMRDGVMPTARSMNVARVVGVAGVFGSTSVRVLRRDFDTVLLDLATIGGMVEVSVVDIVDVVAVTYRRMAAVWAVLVVVMVVCVCHE